MGPGMFDGMFTAVILATMAVAIAGTLGAVWLLHHVSVSWN